MKILFLTRLFPNDYNSRSGKVMFQQAKELKRLGHEVVVVSPTPFTPIVIRRFREEWKVYSQLPNKELYNGILVFRPRFIDLPIKALKRHSWKSINRFIGRLIERVYKDFKFDIIHAHMGYPDGRVGLELKKKFNVPLITTIRSTDTVKNLKLYKVKEELTKALINSDVVISPSVPIKRTIEEKLRISPKIIGNGTYLTNKVTTNQYLKDKFKDKIVLLSVANLIERKAIDYNIKAVKRIIKKIPDFVYIIIGDGPQRGYLEELVNKLKLNKHVFFKGNLPNEKAMEYMSICDIFSLPSWKETFGLVYIEAMLNQKPIILSRDEAIEGTVIHKYNGMVVEPKNVEQLVDSIKFLCTNVEAAKKISINGEKTVLKHYLWSHIGEELERVYMNLLDKNKSG